MNHQKGLATTSLEGPAVCMLLHTSKRIKPFVHTVRLSSPCQLVHIPTIAFAGPSAPGDMTFSAWSGSWAPRFSGIVLALTRHRKVTRCPPLPRVSHLLATWSRTAASFPHMCKHALNLPIGYICCTLLDV